MTITAGMVKELREKTGAGMMDCKSALTETDGDIEAAVDWLRTKGLAKAAKKAGRVAAEGLIGVASAPGRAVMVEVNSETDFVARNADFQKLVAGIAEAALATDGSLAAVLAAKMPGSAGTVDEAIKAAVATIGENMTLRRVAADRGQPRRRRDLCPQRRRAGPRQDRRHRRPRSRPATRASSPRSAGRWRCTSPPRTRLRSGRRSSTRRSSQRERAIFAEQARESGKPEAIIEKMVEGRIRKFYEEVVLLSQTFVVDTEKTVEKAPSRRPKPTSARRSR